MAGDVLKKVQAGAPLVIPAQAFNAFVDAARDYQDWQQGTARRAGESFLPGGVVLVRNDSGADRNRFEVLGVGTPIYTPTDNLDEFKNRIALRGVVPDTALHEGRFVILAEPLAAGAIGRAYAAGVSVVRVLVTDEAHRSADVATGVAASLASQEAGSAAILWKEPGTGEKWAVVRLGKRATAGGSPGPSLGDTVPQIVSNTGTVGASSDARRDDTVSGNKLVGGIDGGAALGHATLEYCAAGAGQQVRVKSHAYPWSNPLLVDAEGLYVAYDDDSIVMGEDGLEVDWFAFPGAGVLAYDGDHWFVVYDDETIGGGGGMLHVLVDGETIVAAPGGGIHVIAAWPLITNENGVGLLHGDSLDTAAGGLNVKCKPGGGIAYDHEGLYVTGLTASDISDFADAVDARIASALANHTMGGANETGPPCSNWSPVT